MTVAPQTIRLRQSGAADSGDGPATSLVIAPHGCLLLVPGSGPYPVAKHIAAPLRYGASVPVRFTFSMGGTVEIDVPMAPPSYPVSGQGSPGDPSSDTPGMNSVLALPLARGDPPQRRPLRNLHVRLLTAQRRSPSSRSRTTRASASTDAIICFRPLRSRRGVGGNGPAVRCSTVTLPCLIVDDRAGSLLWCCRCRIRRVRSQPAPEPTFGQRVRAERKQLQPWPPPAAPSSRRDAPEAGRVSRYAGYWLAAMSGRGPETILGS